MSADAPDLAENFLTFVSAGRFVRAAERLHVTQAAVSACVQALEGRRGQRLFGRDKVGARG